jgi:hypothetical protein
MIDNLSNITDMEIQDDISKVCKLVWEKNYKERELLIPQTFVYLISRALFDGNKDIICRLYSVREALNFFDFANESCDFIKSKLLKVVIFLNP